MPAELDLQVTAGTLGGSGALTVNGLFTWSDGTLSTAGGITTTGTSELDGGGNLTLTTTLTNTGTANWRDGDLLITGGTYDNQSLFEVLTPDSGQVVEGASGVFRNSGTLRKTSNVTTPFNNSGSLSNTGRIEVDAGTLSLNRGSSTTGGGVFDVASGATLRFNGGTQAMTNPSGFEASGVGGRVVLSSGTFAPNASVTMPAELDLQVTAGTLGGSGNLTVNGLFTWSDGTLSTAGGITTAGTSELDGGGNLTLTTTLTNTGTANWRGGDLVLQSSVYDNQGTYNILTTATGDVVESSGLFRNTGASAVITKGQIGNIRFTNSGGIVNSGLVDLRAGTLTVNNGIAQTGGETRLDGMVAR
jgi:hypothetical protein